MKKGWIAALLALTLCVAEALPATAADEAEVFLQTEEAQIADDIPIESEEIIEELLPPTETETETEQLLNETEALSNDELTIDLSGAADGSVIDLSEAADDIGDGLSEDTADPWGTAPTADTEQTEIPIDAEHFPDENFRNYLFKAEYKMEGETDGKTAYKKIPVDTDGNRSLSTGEIAAVKELDVIGKNISDLTGIAYFTALTTLQCDNNALTTLDVSKNAKLECLTCSNNQLTALDLKNNTALFSLVCTGNQIETLDLSRNTRMQDLRCANNKLQALDLSHTSILTWMDCSGNQLSTLDVSKQTSLSYLFCSSNQLTSLNVSGATKLQWLDCSNNQLEELDVKGVLNVDQDTAVNLLNCADNRLTELNVNNKSYFKGLICSNNAITELDLSTDSDLRQLECANNALTSLKLPQAASATSKIKLQTLDCSGNQLTSLDLSSLSITETSVLPNCSGQKLAIASEETENGLQVNLNELLGSDVNIIQMTADEYTNSTGSEKSTLGNVILLLPENGVLSSESANGNLFFKDGLIPETLKLFCATGYRKKDGEKDVLLELCCHVHDSPVEKKAPTCTQDGSAYIHCSVCGYEETIVLPATGHDYREDSDRKEPTCEEEGYSKKICNICGDTVTEELPALGHKFVRMEAPATCTTDGSSWEECEVCGAEKEGSRQTLPAPGHKFQKQEIPSTCTTDGSSWEECEVCGAEKEGSRQTLPAPGHKFQKREIPATCTTGGSSWEECEVCGAEKEKSRQTLPAPGHKFQKQEIPSTCTTDGSSWEECEVCGAEKEESRQTLPAPGHKYGAFTITREATIFADGLRSRTCSVCGDVQSETIPKLNGTIQLAETSMPIQITEKVSVQSLVTGLQENDYVASWQSDNPEIATISKDGTILAKKNGIVNISVTTKSGATATMAVQVQKDPVVTEAITGLKRRMSLAVGEKLRLQPVLTPVSSQQQITYKSSNTKVAKVSSKGVVSGLKKGTAKITVSSGSQEFVIKLTVTAPVTQKIENVPSKKTLRKGKTFRLKPRLALADSSLKFSFKSSNKKVASVNAKGKIKARRKGIAKITVYAGKLKTVCRVTVK